MTIKPTPEIGPMSAVSRILDSFTSHRVVLLNAGLLTAGPAVGAVLGFVFWWLAARYFTPHEAGVATAAISAINVIVLIASLSFGTMMMGLPLNEMPGGRGLVSAAALTSIGLSFVVFVFALVGAHVLRLDLLQELGGPLGASLVLVGAIVVVLADLVDGVLTGYLRNGLRMFRESLVPIVRVSVLALALSLVLGERSFVLLVGIGIGAELLSFLVVGFFLRQAAGGLWERPNFAAMRERLPTAAGHHMLNLTSLGPAAVMPLLVAETLSPAVSAAFYPAWMVLQIVLLAPAGASTALFALGVREPDQMAGRLKFSLALSLAISVIAALVMLFMIEPFLAFLNPAYPELGGTALKFIGFGALGMMLKHHYMAAMRFEHRMFEATPVLALGGIAEVGGAAIGAVMGGNDGLVIGWLIGVSLLALLTLPELVRATSTRGGDLLGGAQTAPAERV